MRTVKKKSNLIIFIITVFFYLMFLPFTSNLFSSPRISHNGSGSGYEEGDKVEKSSSLSGIQFIETYIVYASGSYLQGQSYISSLLNRIEMQDIKGLDMDEVRQILDKALYYMGNAYYIYEMLVWQAETTPYNPEVIARLKGFDYEGYMQQKHLNEAVFKKLAAYLSAGDITGTFEYTLSKMKTIHGLLIDIRKDLNLNCVSDLELFWQLHECFAEAGLFGSYAARIFANIK